MGFLRCMYVCTLRTHGAHRSQKRALAPLELKLEMLGGHGVGAGDQSQSSGRVAGAFNF